MQLKNACLQIVYFGNLNINNNVGSTSTLILDNRAATYSLFILSPKTDIISEIICSYAVYKS